MQVILTPKFVKLLGKIKEKRGREETQKIISKIQDAKDFNELHNTLDIKKYEIGGYRIRYSGKPEMRIRFALIPDPSDETKKIPELRFVGTREEYERIAHKPMNESFQKRRVYVLTESQIKLLTEQNISLWLKRRVSDEDIETHIDDIVLDMSDISDICEDFEDEFDFADSIIVNVLDKIMEEHFNIIDVNYDEIRDQLEEYCKDNFSDYIFEIFFENCQ